MDSKILDLIRVKGKSIIHQQIEKRDGLIFMRMKKMSSMSIR